MTADFVHIYLADDDGDDCLLFGDVLQELEVKTQLTTVCNGSELMVALQGISDVAKFPHLLFLDLNMPIKNGLECLVEIKQDPRLRHLPVIMYSTSAQKEAVDFAYKNGAALFVKKPDSFTKLEQMLRKILSVGLNDNFFRGDENTFLLEI